MKGSRTFMAAVCTAVLSVAAAAQAPSAGPFYTSTCLKVKPEKNSDFRKWERETLHKYAQARLDSGSLISWFVMRAVLPTGTENGCDYVVVGTYPGTPAKPLTPDELSDVLKKAGLGITAEQYNQGRNAVSELAEAGLFRNMAAVGSIQKGDYLVLNLNKTQDVNQWIQLEKKLWQPMAEAFVKQGMTRGWYANVRILPQGTGMRFDTVTVDVYPSWDAYFQFQDSPKLMDIWKQVHPDQDPLTAFADYAKIVNRVAVELWVVEDLVTNSQVSKTGQ
jgi:hypothetical protein